MTNFFNLIKTLRKDLSFLFIISLVTVCLIDFWLINVPEIFKKGHTFGPIVEKLCLSYISAFIFYFLVVHIKQQNDKKNIYTYVAHKSISIIAYGQTIGRDLAKAANVTLKEYYPSRHELLEVCSKVNPYSEEAPLLISMTGQKANWFQYFENYRQQTMSAIQDIYAKMPFLDTKLVRHLSLIENSDFLSVTKAIANIPFQFKNENLLNFTTSIQTYLDTVKEFDKYYKANIKKYK
jgi:hypothetical protein